MKADLIQALYMILSLLSCEEGEDDSFQSIILPAIHCRNGMPFSRTEDNLCIAVYISVFVELSVF